ncbi:DNA gyrase subunit A, partial [Candidatus Shapirobacteria bacterium]|nr:DNA gyrase subunit A [Candidatus Shapirobacteria bacterium]
VLPVNKDKTRQYIILATKKGTVKKTSLIRFNNIRQSGLTAMKLDSGDQLVWAKLTTGNDQVFLVTEKGKCIRFNESDCRPMGRNTRGVRGILLKDGDVLASMDIVPQTLQALSKEKKGEKFFRHLLSVTENGVGKRSDVYLYPLQKRGGVGVKVSNLTSKTGNIAAAQVVDETDENIILVSKKAVTINQPLKNIPVLNRNTKGVILMRMKTSDDKVNAMTILKTNLS